MNVVASGVVVGLLIALALTRLMSSLLFGVGAADAFTFAAAALLLLAVALVACVVPARRAVAWSPRRFCATSERFSRNATQGVARYRHAIKTGCRFAGGSGPVGRHLAEAPQHQGARATAWRATACRRTTRWACRWRT